MMKRYIMTSNKSFYIYRTILIVLCMIAMAACGGGTPKNTNNNVQQNTIHTTAGLPLTPLVCPSDQSSGSSSGFSSVRSLILTMLPTGKRFLMRLASTIVISLQSRFIPSQGNQQHQRVSTK